MALVAGRLRGRPRARSAGRSAAGADAEPAARPSPPAHRSRAVAVLLCRRCCWPGRSGSPRPPTGPPTARSSWPTSAASTRRSRRPRTPRSSTRSRPSRCSCGRRSTPQADRRARTRGRASSAPCCASPATPRPGTGWPPSSSARSTRPSRRSRPCSGALYLDPLSTRGARSCSSRPARGSASKTGARPRRARGSAGRAREQRAAERAPERPTSKPSSSSSRRSERRVKKRRWGESGSRRRARAARFAGVVSASVPPGAQHPPDLREQQLHVAHVLDRLGAQHEVEAAVLERQRRVGLELDDARAGQPPAGPLERDGRDVGGGELARRRARRQPAVAAAEVERRSTRPSARTNSRRCAGGGPGSSGTSSQSSSS